METNPIFKDGTGDEPSRKGFSPVNAYVKSLGEDYHTAKEVAEALGISVQYVRKLSKPGSDGKRVTQAPSYAAPFGKGRVYLYTSEDIEALRTYLDGRKQVMRTIDLEPLGEPEQLRGK